MEGAVFSGKLAAEAIVEVRAGSQDISFHSSLACHRVIQRVSVLCAGDNAATEDGCGGVCIRSEL